MAHRSVGPLVLLVAFAPCLAAQVPAGLTPRDSALHALNRLAYGPGPGEVEQVAAMGVMRWIERQLDPQGIPDRRLEQRERAFAILDYEADELAAMFVEARRAQLERQRDSMTARAAPVDGAAARPFRRLAAEFQQLAVVRATLSERQLLEVMADFWTNHFNVFYAKGADRFLMPSYIEHTIRPNALGRFEDLLIATAQSPAMMFYLDNWQSVAPGSTPPRFPLSAMRRGGQGERSPRGINENYARELLELHTLGVDGGYTQDDVIAVARIFTGWGIERPRDGAGFAFRAWAHDEGEKVVLGQRFPAGHGRDEGLRLLRILAGHHATMHFVSGKLCARFVRDDPPDGCVDDAVAAWHHSGGDIRAVLRAIFRSPDFWAPQTVRAKVKTPLEFVVSAVRALGAEPDTTPRLAQVVGRLGQPLYLQSAPTGYPETQADWVNSGALLNRMNTAVALAAGRLPGVVVRLDDALPPAADQAQLVAAVNARVLGGAMSERTRAAISDQLSAISGGPDARIWAVGLAIGGPEFQRQ